MIELIITDLDGTLVPEGSLTLNPEYFEIIKQLQKKGVHFIAASGRQLHSIRKLLAPIADDIDIIGQNGSVLLHDHKTIVPNPIPVNWPQEMWQEIKAIGMGAECFVSTASCAYLPEKESPMYRILTEDYGYVTEVTSGYDQIPQGEYNQLTLYYPDGAGAFFREHLDQKWEERLVYLISGDKWVDMVMPGNGKGPALQFFLNLYGIDPENVLAFGDNLNDISMLDLAGNAMTVIDARDEVKEHVQKILPSYKEDGVLQELKRVLASLS